MYTLVVQAEMEDQQLIEIEKEQTVVSTVSIK